LRPVHIAPYETDVRRAAGGVTYMLSPQTLRPYPSKLTERLELWADRVPDRTFLAERDQQGEWRRLTFRDALRRVRSLAQAIVDRRLSEERTIVILSGNSIEHALLALAAMYAGVPYAPIAPAYSLQARDFGTLRLIFDRMRPGLVFAAEGAAFERALRETLPGDAELIVSASSPAQLRATHFAELEQVSPGTAVDAAHARVGPDTTAKVLFTSGSTGRPKGVINTQRMLCSNQEMIRATLRFLGDDPPVLCDWLPWNHTAGGNHNFGIALYNGGTLYIDEGRPTPALFGATVRNLTDIPCVAHFTVPRFYEMLMPHLRSNAALREAFFRDLKLIFYAAAGLGQRFWDELKDVSIEACGEEILIMAGLGATETAPFAITTAGYNQAFAGMVGLPAPAMELKLAPVGEKLEARVRGPNVTPGYYRDEAMTRAAFDEEGFYRLGDAMTFVDPADPAKGLIFDGRLAEDFKLSTGTWVSVGPLRSKILAAAGGLAQDVVIAAPDRDFVSALIFPNVAACRAMCGADRDALSVAEVLAHDCVRRAFQESLATLAAASTGGSTFVARAVLLEQGPSIDAREMTDKGSLNQKAVLENRRDVLDEIYSTPPPRHVLTAAAPRP
jgi:feruloyl-CoA synthase